MVLNGNQKKALLGFAILLLVIIFLHNPSGGYISHQYSPYLNEDSNGESLERIEKCTSQGDGSGLTRFSCEKVYKLPFYKWLSKQALVAPLTPVSTILWSFILISFGSALSYVLLKENSD